MSSSIISLKNISNGRPVLILGDILELGKFASEKHELLIPLIEKMNPRAMIAIGEEMNNILQKIQTDCEKFSFNDSLSASSKIVSILKNNDFVLIKGSQGMNLKIIVEKIVEVPIEIEKIIEVEKPYIF